MNHKWLYDPRLWQILIISSYSIVAREFFNFERPHYVTLSVIICAVLLDFLIGRFHFGKKRFPIGTIITGFACSLLIDSPIWAFYIVAGILAVLSKAFILFEKRHIFNPANFGVVCILLLFPEYVVGMPHLFAGNIEVSYYFLIAGFIISVFAKVWDIVIAFMLAFTLFAFMRAGFDWYKGLTNLYIILSPAVLLFMFHMITDPPTSPKSRLMRLFWGVSIAFLDYLFRVMHIPYGNFYALFAMSCCLPFLLTFEKGAANEMVQKQPA